MTRRQSKQCRDAMAAIRRIRGELISIYETAGKSEALVSRVMEDVLDELAPRYAYYELARALGLPSELPSITPDEDTDTEEPE